MQRINRAQTKIFVGNHVCRQRLKRRLQWRSWNGQRRQMDFCHLQARGFGTWFAIELTRSCRHRFIDATKQETTTIPNDAFTDSKGDDQRPGWLGFMVFVDAHPQSCIDMAYGNRRRHVFVEWVMCQSLVVSSMLHEWLKQSLARLRDCTGETSSWNQEDKWNASSPYGEYFGEWHHPVRRHENTCAGTSRHAVPDMMSTTEDSPYMRDNVKLNCNIVYHFYNRTPDNTWPDTYIDASNVWRRD